MRSGILQLDVQANASLSLQVYVCKPKSARPTCICKPQNAGCHA